MLPALQLGPLSLQTYGLTLVAALWLALWLGGREATRNRIAADHVWNCGLIALFVGLVGARLWFVASHWQNYSPQPLAALSPSLSALAVEEGVIIGLAAGLVYLLRHGIPLSTFADALAPGLAAGLGVAAVGAFLDGRALGVPTDLPWGIYLLGAVRHPTQLYEALAHGLVFLLLWGVRRRQPWAGFSFWLLVALYGILHLFLENLRENPTLIGDGYRMMQIVGLTLILISLAVMARHFIDLKQPSSRNSS